MKAKFSSHIRIKLANSSAVSLGIFYVKFLQVANEFHLLILLRQTIVCFCHDPLPILYLSCIYFLN